MNSQSTIITGPFKQLLTMAGLPMKGSISDDQLEVIEEGGIVHRDGTILEVGLFNALKFKYKDQNPEIQNIDYEAIGLPGFIDPHTHICWAGSRETDYAMRLEGKSYSEIAQSGGGIWDTVVNTRNASDEELGRLLLARANRQLNNGITTCEVKSGYGLNVEEELRLLEIINSVNRDIATDLLPTCLAAHIKPKDFAGNSEDYLSCLAGKLLPLLKERKLTNRIDIFVEEGAFTADESAKYLSGAAKSGFDLVVHGEQFTSGGVNLAVGLKAKSVDHLEVIGNKEISLLASSDVVAIVLPGASLGLGCNFAPARKLLDAGCCLAIGSDWNPGSAPMGHLLLQAAILGTFEKLTCAEQLSAITFRAAHSLSLYDRGTLKNGNLADFTCFPGKNYREILYQQGMLKPAGVWKIGRPLLTHNS
jgi:imidazolonepropionase